MKKIDRNSGITLIALVVTIVILLILAGVSITAVIGNNSLIEKTKDAKLKTQSAGLEEKIKILVSEEIIEQYSNNPNSEMPVNEFQDKLNEQGENVLIIKWDQYIIFDLTNNKEYRIMSNGNLEYWGESTIGTILLNSKTPNDDQIMQDSSTQNIIGIDKDGNKVNMLLWEYTLIDDENLGKVGTYGLNDKNGLDGSGKSGRSAGYIGEYTDDGKIQGTVPAYISTDGGNTYISVTSMAHTFYDCDTLLTAPEIPDTVTNMQVAFYQASKLVNPPQSIPDSVNNLIYTFADCSCLSQSPSFGRNIENMYATFCGCSNLESVSKLPEKVTNLRSTFQNCTKLSNSPSIIPDSVVDMKATFSGCSSLENAPNILSKKLQSMESTFLNCTKLQTFQANIPDSVTNMGSTFQGCVTLANVTSVIPNSVNNMFRTFRDCSNLQGKIEINASINGNIVLTYNSRDYYDYSECFLRASTNGDGLIISNDSICSELDNLLNSKSSNSNISLENTSK